MAKTVERCPAGTPPAGTTSSKWKSLLKNMVSRFERFHFRHHVRRIGLPGLAEKQSYHLDRASDQRNSGGIDEPGLVPTCSNRGADR